MPLGRNPEPEMSQAEQALRESEQRYRSWFENAPLPMWVYDTDSLSFLTVNDAAIRKYGYSRQEFLAMTIRDIRPDAEIPHLLELMAAPEHDSTRISTVKHRTKDGTTLVVEVYSQLASWAGKRAKLVQVQDISERKRAEATLREFSAQLSRLQEEERRKIARDLHDTIGQSLTALSGNLAALTDVAEMLPLRERKALSESLALARSTSREIRTLSYLLYPPMLDEEGLASALDLYIDGFSARSGIRVALEIAPEIGRLPQELETTLFRIVQESLTNMHRHSETSTGEIRMRVVSGEIVLEIEDRGKGIARPTLEKINRDGAVVGVGIAGMRERMRQIGGQLEIESGSPGTTIRALLPYPG
jgi:PAS domain S-box-containing protein